MPPTEGTVSRIRILIAVLIATILIASLIATHYLRPIAVNDSENKLPIFWFVYLAALLGSVVNESQRNHEQISMLKWHLIAVFISWKVLIAMTFAVFLYVACASGIVGGELFPQFQGVKEVSYTHMIEFIRACKPATDQDVAKVLVWSFVAGYSERFVPNIIHGIRMKEAA